MKGFRSIKCDFLLSRLIEGREIESIIVTMETHECTRVKGFFLVRVLIMNQFLNTPLFPLRRKIMPVVRECVIG